MVYTTEYLSPLGTITLACDEEAIVGLWFNGQRYFGSILPRQTERQERPLFQDARRWLDVYFSGRAPDHLPGFAVCNIGDRTCIDNIDICPFFKWHDLISILLQKLLHSLCLICIYFAAQIMERSFLFHFTHSFQNIW